MGDKRREILITASQELKKKHGNSKNYMFDVSYGSSDSGDSSRNTVKTNNKKNQFSDTEYKDKDDEGRSLSNNSRGNSRAKMMKIVNDHVNVAEEKNLKPDNMKPFTTTSGKKSLSINKNENHLIAVAFVDVSVDFIRENDRNGDEFQARYVSVTQKIHNVAKAERTCG